MKSISASFLFIGLTSVAALVGCGSSSSSSSSDTSGKDGGTGTGTTGSTNTPSCSTACSHAVAACSEVTSDQCTSACASATSSQISCIASASSCTALQACESSTSSGGSEDGGTSSGGGSGGSGGSGGTGGSSDDGGGTTSGDDGGGCDTFTEQTYTFTLASGADWSNLDVNVNAQSYDSTGAKSDVMGGILDNRGTTMTYTFKGYGCTPKVNVTIDYAVIGGTSCTGGPVDLTENDITVAAPTVDTTQMTCTAPTPM